MLEGAQQRPADQVVAPEQILLAQLRALRLGEADAEQLARIVPLVQRLGGVDPVVALQADQRGVEHGGQRLARLGLADAGLALEQQRLGQPQAEEHRGGERLVDQVVDRAQAHAERLDVGHQVADLVGRLAGHARGRHAVACARSNARWQPSPQK